MHSWNYNWTYDCIRNEVLAFANGITPEPVGRLEKSAAPELKLWAMSARNSGSPSSSFATPCTCLIVALTDATSAYMDRGSSPGVHRDRRTNRAVQVPSTEQDRSWSCSASVETIPALNPINLKAFTNSPVQSAPEPSSSSRLKQSMMSVSCWGVRGPAGSLMACFLSHSNMLILLTAITRSDSFMFDGNFPAEPRFLYIATLALNARRSSSPCPSKASAAIAINLDTCSRTMQLSFVLSSLVVAITGGHGLLTEDGSFKTGRALLDNSRSGEELVTPLYAATRDGGLALVSSKRVFGRLAEIRQRTQRK